MLKSKFKNIFPRVQKYIFVLTTNERSGNSNVFASPTDNMLSPCTEKLKNHKNRFFANQKVTKLNLKSSMSKEKGGSKLSSEIEGKDVDELLKARKPAKREEDEIDEDEMMKNINFDDI